MTSLRLAPLALAALVAACATPFEQCASGAAARYDAALRAAETAEGNIARGYAIHRQRVPYRTSRFCYHPRRGHYWCDQTLFRTQETPVAIDVGAERAKLRDLRARLPALRATAESGVRQCALAHGTAAG